MSDFLQGATALASLAVALFFLRSWRVTRDPLLAVFSAAFFVFALNRVALSTLDEDAESRLLVYLTRALVFTMIAAAVVWKNVGRRR